MFEALDRNGDGDLAADDFADDSALEIEMRSIGARTTLARFLQDDDDASRFTLDELFLAAEAFDADADELLEEDEFRALATERRHWREGQLFPNSTR